MRITKHSRLKYKILRWAIVAFCLAGLSFFLLYWLNSKIATTCLLTTRYVEKSEISSINALQAFVSENEIKTTNTSAIERWVDRQHISALTFSQSHTIIFDYQPGVNSYHDFRAQSSLSGLIWIYLKPITFSDGVANAFIDTGAIARIYYLALILSLLISLLLWSIIFLIAINKMLKRIELLDHEVSAAYSGNFDTPVTVSGSDEISHLANEIDSARKNLKEHRDQREKLEKEQWDFVSGMSHDLRTPITIILTYLSLAESSPSLEDARTFIQPAWQNALKLRELSNDVFENFLLDTRTAVELSGPELFSSAIGDNLSEFVILLRENHFRTDTSELRFPEQSILFVPSYIDRIFTNMLSNIPKYAVPGSMVKLSLKVRENGIGLSIKNETAYQITSNQGTGIGLKNNRR